MIRRIYNSFLRRFCLFTAVLLAALATAPTSQAQLSPGGLSKVHTSLEGARNCQKCHSPQKGVDPDLCLACHSPLAQRISAGLGLHSDPEYKNCKTCHIDHHGEDFELIWWGDSGLENFDHSQTGYKLESAHSSVPCRSCHRSELIKEKAALESHGKNLTRTYLGLERACLSCHKDEHRQQVAADSCLTCHTMAAWSPAARFDHQETEFPLAGAHLEAKCSGCHRRLTDIESAIKETYLQLSGFDFSQCSACHEDPHRGKLSLDCVRCHDTSGWRGPRLAGFEHDQTGFLLRGKHQALDCSQCHSAGRGLHFSRYQTCQDCHLDNHRGQFAHLTDSTCESCHTLTSFQPSTYSLRNHQQSKYPLEGAHRAVACTACHQLLPNKDSVDPGDLSKLSGRNHEDFAPRQFRFLLTRCSDCHKNPHQKEADRVLAAGGCNSCHSLDGWKIVAFEHDRTEFQLIGSHSKLSCLQCHSTPIDASPGGKFQTSQTSRACSSCHQDPHHGQFDSAGETAECSRCHNSTRWQETLFNHDRDADYRLEGAHRDLQCKQCHYSEISESGSSYRRYKPLSGECTSCHQQEIQIH